MRDHGITEPSEALIDEAEHVSGIETKGDCCLCKEKFTTLLELRNHLGEHQRQLALFALPTLKSEEHEEVENIEEAASSHNSENSTQGSEIQENSEPLIVDMELPKRELQEQADSDNLGVTEAEDATIGLVEAFDSMYAIKNAHGIGPEDPVESRAKGKAQATHSPTQSDIDANLEARLDKRGYNSSVMWTNVGALGNRPRSSNLDDLNPADCPAPPRDHPFEREEERLAEASETYKLEMEGLERLRMDMMAGEEENEVKKAAAEEYRLKIERVSQEVEEERKRIIAEFERKRLEGVLSKQQELQEERRKRIAAIFMKREEQEMEREKTVGIFKTNMRERPVKFGLQEDQIEHILQLARAQEIAVDLNPANPPESDHYSHLDQKPIYPKIHRDHLAIETLTYHGLPWEWDRSDTDYIIILREMDPRETDILFDHTRRIRSKISTETRPLVERTIDGKSGYSWAHKRSNSNDRIRVRSAPTRIRNVGEFPSLEPKGSQSTYGE